jgi:signal transduction histidine kinase
MINSTESTTPLPTRAGAGDSLTRKPATYEPPARANIQRIMRLADFILANRAAILAEWEEFAKSCAPASASMSITALSDHASEMLTVIAEDLKTPQGSFEQSQKSKGHAPVSLTQDRTAAEKHGTGRAVSGFTLDQMVAEYRALRASVIRLWMKEQGEITSTDLDDLTRFNEAIDQSLSESITRFTQDLDNSKEMFLAILGHDLRTPIGAVMTSAKFMLETKELAEPHLTLTSRIVSSATRMNQMVGALLDFTRSRLGGGIPISPAKMNLGKVVHDVVEEISAAHPGRTIEVNARGALKGEWDCARMSQVLTNLIGNALEHGSDRTAVTVDVHGDEKDVSIAIHNRGAAIPEDQLDGIFNAMKRQGMAETGKGPSGNLGLGLYIADQIVHAHKGRIDVESSEERGTTFTVHLPRSA